MCMYDNFLCGEGKYNYTVITVVSTPTLPFNTPLSVLCLCSVYNVINYVRNHVLQTSWQGCQEDFWGPGMYGLEMHTHMWVATSVIF